MSSLRCALLDATNEISALRIKQDNYITKLKDQIVLMEQRAVRDTERTVDSIVNWKMEALKKTREAVRSAEDEAQKKVKELNRKIAGYQETLQR